MNNEPEKQPSADTGQAPPSSAQPHPAPVIKRRQHYYTNLPTIGLEAEPLTAPWEDAAPQDGETEDDYDYPDGYKPAPSSKTAMAAAVSVACVIAVAVLALLVYVIFFSAPKPPVGISATADSAPAEPGETQAPTIQDFTKIVVMPNLNGLKEAEAYKRLNAAEVRYKIARVNSEEVPFNYVVSQNPSPGSEFPRSEEAVVYISKGKVNEIVEAPGRTKPTAAATTAPSSTAATGATDASSLLAADYILPNSAAGELTKNDLRRLDKTTLNLALNEIYARHGRKFDDPAIQAHFDSKSWYHPTISGKDFDMSILNRYEIANINLITDYQSEMGYR